MEAVIQAYTDVVFWVGDFPSGIGPLSGLVHQAEATYRIRKYVHLLACKSTSGLHSSEL